MKNLWIIKAGRTFPAWPREHGDFEHWICREMGLGISDVRVHDVRGTESLPEPRQCAGVVVTGSHAMVTDRLPWSVALENWIPGAGDGRCTFLGDLLRTSAVGQRLGWRSLFQPART